MGRDRHRYDVPAALAVGPGLNQRGYESLLFKNETARSRATFALSAS
jgi:hypothetical protein